MTLFTQCYNLSFWLNRNTKLKVSYIFDAQEESFHIDIINNNSEEIYTQTINKIMTRAEKVIIFDLNRLINFLLNLKKQKQEELKIKI